MRLLLITCLAACGSDDQVHHLGDAPIPPQARGIYITQAGAVSMFALDATGDVAPIRTITGTATGLSVPIGFDVEPVTGNLYVANRTGGTVTVYPPDGTGNRTPEKTLTATGMGSPEGVAFTTAGDLFVSTCPSCGTANGGQVGVWHFAPNSTTSDRTIGATTNASTGFTNPGTLAIDPDTGELVVGNSFGGNVATFLQSASGDVAPAHAFVPAATNLQSIAVGGGIVFVTSPGGGGVVQMYTTSATGTPTPASISNGGALMVNYPGGVAVDLVESPPVIYLADYFGNALHVIHTAGTAPDLTVARVDVIKGPATGIQGPLGIRVVR
jgi:DNA-binding beta-propeller fold protein YncE